MIVYLARVIPAFVMYCVYGASRSSLLIESTDSMIFYVVSNQIYIDIFNSYVSPLLISFTSMNVYICTYTSDPNKHP